MQNLLSSRGLAALAWLSTFAALWLNAFERFPSRGGFWIVFSLSLILAAFAMAAAHERR